MIELFRLIRFRTIAFAAFTMYAVRYFVIQSILGLNFFSLQMTDWAFALLVVSVCCLVAGAYVINDYFDTKADRIAGVREVVVGRSITRRTAITLHTVLNVVSVGIAFYLGYAVGIWKIGVLFLLISGILWFYSSTYKKYFIVGNLLAAIMTALIPFSVLIYEIPLLNMAYADKLIETGTNFMYMFTWVGGVAWFIFLNTLIYEINKDIYTVDGDREDGTETLAARLGVGTAKNVILVLTGISIVSLLLLYILVFHPFWWFFAYFLVAMIIPYIIYAVSVVREQRRLFQLRMIRLIMVMCVGGCFLLKYFFLLLIAG